MPDKILRKAEVVEATRLCDNTLRTLEAAGLFPKRFSLLPGAKHSRAVGWSQSAVMGWIEERAASVQAA